MLNLIKSSFFAGGWAFKILKFRSQYIHQFFYDLWRRCIWLILKPTASGGIFKMLPSCFHSIQNTYCSAVLIYFPFVDDLPWMPLRRFVVEIEVGKGYC